MVDVDHTAAVLQGLPSKGTQMSHNGKALIMLPDHDFKQMLFGLGLSGNPAQESLKEAMLGEALL